MSYLSEIKTDSGLYTMLKGEPGTTKSTMALTYPLPQYWFSVDKKMRALQLPMKHYKIDPSKVEYDDYKDWAGIEAKLIKLQERCRTSNGDLIRTIVFDSVTSIGNVTNIQTRSVKAAEGVTGNIIGGIRINTLEDYKAESSAFVTLIDRTKEMQIAYGVNIILIAHVVGERAEKEVGVTSHARIIITGGKTISGTIPAYCEEIYHFDAQPSAFEGEGVTINCITQYTGDDFARTCLPMEKKFTVVDKGNYKNLYQDFVLPAQTRLGNK